MSLHRNWDSPTPSLASECAPPPGTKWGGEGHTRLRVRGVGKSQFQRRDKKPSSLSTCTLCTGVSEGKLWWILTLDFHLYAYMCSGGGGGWRGEAAQYCTNSESLCSVHMAPGVSPTQCPCAQVFVRARVCGVNNMRVFCRGKYCPPTAGRHMHSLHPETESDRERET
jgi:hypothetical protein